VLTRQRSQDAERFESGAEIARFVSNASTAERPAVQVPLGDGRLTALSEPANGTSGQPVGRIEGRDAVRQQVVADPHCCAHRLLGDWLARRPLAQVQQGRDAGDAPVVAPGPIRDQAEIPTRAKARLELTLQTG
jgi:hypothetical protein